MAIEALNSIQHWDKRKKLTFAYLTCERLFPNYVFFHQQYNFGNPSILRAAIDFIRDAIFNNSIDTTNITRLMANINPNVPAPEEYDTVLASSALDACTTIENTFEYLMTENDSLIKGISTMATDSVDMYIQERDDLDYSDKEFEKKIANDPLMQKELKIQNGIVLYLNKIKNISPSDIETLLELQDNNKGNLNL